MPITYQSRQSVTSSTSPLTVNRPAGTVQGDFLLAVVVVSGVTSGTIPGIGAPADWSAIRTISSSNGTTSHTRMTVFAKVATASEPASYDFTFTNGDGTHSHVAFVHRFSGAVGVETSAALDNGVKTSSAGIEAPSVTPAGDGRMLFVAVGGRAGGAFDNWTFPAPMVPEGNSFTTATTVGHSAVAMGREDRSSGATGSRTVTWTGADIRAVGMSLALRPSQLDVGLSAVAGSLASLVTEFIAGQITRTLVAVATGSPSLIRRFYSTLSAAATGSPALVAARKFFRTLLATARGTATMTRAKKVVKALTASGTGLPSLSMVRKFARLLAAVSAVSVTLGVAKLLRATWTKLKSVFGPTASLKEVEAPMASLRSVTQPTARIDE